MLVVDVNPWLSIVVVLIMALDTVALLLSSVKSTIHFDAHL
jgi:hypothetical protein